MKVIAYMVVILILLAILIVRTWFIYGPPSLFVGIVIGALYLYLLFRVYQYEEDAQ